MRAEQPPPEQPPGAEIFSALGLGALSQAFFDQTRLIAQGLGLPPFMHALALEHCARSAEGSLMKMAQSQAEIDHYNDLKAKTHELLAEVARGGGV